MAAPCAHTTMTLHTQTLSTTFANDFCACQLSPFKVFRLICSVFVYYFIIWSFAIFERLRGSNGCSTRIRTPNWMFFVTEDFCENEHFTAALGSGSDSDDWPAGRPWLGCQQRFNFKWQWRRFYGNVPDSNASLTSRLRLVYVNLCFYFPSHYKNGMPVNIWGITDYENKVTIWPDTVK